METRKRREKLFRFFFGAAAAASFSFLFWIIILFYLHVKCWFVVFFESSVFLVVITEGWEWKWRKC